MQTTIKNALASSVSYPEYRRLVADLVKESKTTGPNQSEFYLDITRLNQSRMDRLDKKARFTPDTEKALAELSPNYTLLVITEAWCGDAAQTVPFFNHLAAAHPKLNLRLVLRDEHPELMDHFLTNDARSIPKVIFLDPVSNVPKGVWGPRPAPAQKMVMDYKNLQPPRPDYQVFTASLHKWYAQDKTRTLQEEVIVLLRQLESKAPAGNT